MTFAYFFIGVSKAFPDILFDFLILLNIIIPNYSLPTASEIKNRESTV